MEKRKLLLAEGNEEFAMSLEAGLRDRYILRVCKDGQTALQLMHAFRPDILVLDLMLPGLDGISLLQSLTEVHLTPMVLATTRYCNDYMLEQISRYGVGYLLIKPCNIRATIARIADLSSRISEPDPIRPDPTVYTANMLREFGIRVKLKGFRYLQGAIGMLAEDPDREITKELYRELAKIHNTSTESVERCIRTAIESAWIVRDPELWQTYFPPKSGKMTERPTNGTFIARLAQRLNAELYPWGREKENAGNFSDQGV